MNRSTYKRNSNCKIAGIQRNKERAEYTGYRIPESPETVRRRTKQIKDPTSHLNKPQDSNNTSKRTSRS